MFVKGIKSIEDENTEVPNDIFDPNTHKEEYEKFTKAWQANTTKLQPIQQAKEIDIVIPSFDSQKHFTRKVVKVDFKALYKVMIDIGMEKSIHFAKLSLLV